MVGRTGDASPVSPAVVTPLTTVKEQQLSLTDLTSSTPSQPTQLAACLVLAQLTTADSLTERKKERKGRAFI